jgi:hypothetical protein
MKALQIYSSADCVNAGVRALARPLAWRFPRARDWRVMMRG